MGQQDQLDSVQWGLNLSRVEPKLSQMKPGTWSDVIILYEMQHTIYKLYVSGFSILS